MSTAASEPSIDGGRGLVAQRLDDCRRHIIYPGPDRLPGYEVVIGRDGEGIRHAMTPSETLA